MFLCAYVFGCLTEIEYKYISPQRRRDAVGISLHLRVSAVKKISESKRNT